MKSKKGTVKRLIRFYIFPHKFKIFFALLMMIISAGATGLHAWLVRPALDDVLIKGDEKMLLLIPMAIIITTLCKGLATYLHSFQMSKVAHNIIATLQSEMFQKLMFFNISFFNDSKSGNLISRLINDTYFLRMAIVKTVTGVIKDFLVIIFLLGNMFYQSWQLTIFAFFAFPLALWPIKKIGKSIRKITYTIQNEIAVFSNVLGESIKGIRQVKAYNQEKYETSRAFKTIQQIKNYFIRSAFISNRLSPLMEFIGSLAIALSIYVGGVFVLDESMTTGQFMSFLVSLLLAYQPVKALGNLNISVQEGLAGAERIFELMDTSENSFEKTNAEKKVRLRSKAGRLTIEEIWKEYLGVNSDKLKVIHTDNNRFLKHLAEPFGKKFPDELVPLDFDRFESQLTETYSAKSIANILELLRRIINFGVEKQLCPPLLFKIKLPRVDNERIEVLTDAQFARLNEIWKEYPNQHIVNLHKLIAWAGMRPSEPCRLKWEDINSELGLLIKVNTKSGKNIQLRLSNTVKQILESQRTLLDDSSPAMASSEYVFPRSDGHKREPESLQIRPNILSKSC